MRVAAFQSLLYFTLYAILSTSVVVAIPIQGQDVDSRVARRLSRDADIMPASLYRRTKPGPTRSRSSSPGAVRPKSPAIASSSKLSSSTCPVEKQVDKANIIAICLAVGPSKLHKRQFIDGVLRPRTSDDSAKSDDDKSTLEDIDPGLKHKVDSPPALGICLDKGSWGSVYQNPSDGNSVIKHVGETINHSDFFPFTPGHLRREVDALKKVNQFQDFSYTMTPEKTIGEAWITMVKVPGSSFRSLGFSSSAKTPEITDFAKRHPRNGEARKAFLQKAIDMMVEKAHEYAEKVQMKHADISAGNVMIEFNPGTDTIKSVDFVDWYKTKNFKDVCTPIDKAKIKTDITAIFKKFF